MKRCRKSRLHWAYGFTTAWMLIGMSNAVAETVSGSAVRALETPWSYRGENGPARWGELTEKFRLCAEGSAQSPIDITTATISDLAPIRFDYDDSPIYLVNNGHTIQFNYAKGSSLAVGGERFELIQFHFHSPSEHTLGGRAFPLEAHLVHKADNGKLVAVAVLFEEGDENALVARLWEHLPTYDGEMRVLHKMKVNVRSLLPPGRTYFTYRGSLTIPPCTENVTWLVMSAPVAVSRAQVEQFRQIYANNVRPVMPLNGRVVKLAH